MLPDSSAHMALRFPAHADYPFMFAQIVCALTVGYFSIRRITIMNDVVEALRFLDPKQRD
jgi:hypothetical protein